MVSRWKTTDEVRQNYMAAMGPDLGELFHVLSNELTWVHWRWQQYRILFGEKPTRLDLLNEAAPFFFRIVQDVFFEDTLLAIARLVGPEKSMGKPNLSITRLPQLLSDETLRDDVCRLVEKAKSAAGFAVDWRNRHLAHRDLELVLHTALQPLASASRQQVEEALSALRDVLNRIESALCRATTAYRSSPLTGDAETLLYVVRGGIKREREKRECWEKGELHEDDLRPPEAV